MSRDLNRVDIIGRLGKDPEIRRMTSGDKVVSFSVATGETWIDKASGEKKERTEWHTVVIFNEGLCEVAEKYLKKGSKVFLSGSMQTRKWQDKDGSDRWSTEVVLQRFRGELQLLGDPSGRTAPSPNDYGTTRNKPTGENLDRYRETGAGLPQQARGGGAPIEDDIPFAPEWR